MNAYIPYIVFGLVDGSIYGLAAMGLVLTYKTSGVFNFGHGAVAAAAAYVFYELRDVRHVPWGLAVIITVFGFGIAAGLLLELLGRGLASVTTANRIVATVGLFIGISGLMVVIFGSTAQVLRPFLPRDTTAFTVSNVHVNGEQLVVFLVGVTAAAGLFAYFRTTRTGKAMRAVVDDPRLLDLTGASPVRVRRTAWLIGTCFASASGIVLALRLNVDSTTLPLLVISAFGAATFGAFTSIPLAFAGGLAVGLLQDISSKVVATHPSWQGLDINMPFIVLFIGLLVIPRHKLVEAGQHVRAVAPVARRLPPPVGRVVTAAALAVAATVPLWAGTKLPIWIGALPYALLFLSLALLVRTSGQISLCQIGFMAVGASTTGHLLVHHVPWLIAVLLAGLITLPVGAFIAIPAIRLSGLYLGLATLGFGVLLNYFAYGKSFMFGQTGGLRTPRPHALGLDGQHGYYYLLLIAFGLAALVVIAVERSRLGRLLRGLADSPIALEVHGADTNVTRVLVFCISAFLAGIAGALSGPITGVVSGDTFPYAYSLIVLAVLAISQSVLATVPAAAGAALLYKIVPGYIDSSTLNEYLPVLFGAGAILAALLARPVGLPARFRPAYVAAMRRRRGPVAARLSANRSTLLLHR